MSKIRKLIDFLLVNKTIRQTAAKNTFWLGVSQLGSRLIRAVIIIYAARVLGAGEYGIFSYTLGVAGFFTLFADIGINPLLTRDVARNRQKQHIVFVNSLWAKTALLGIVSLLVLWLSPLFITIEAARQFIPFIVVILVADGIREFCVAFLRGMEKMETEALIAGIMNITIMGAGIAALIISKTAYTLLWAYAASVTISAIIAITLIRTHIKKVFSFVRIAHIRHIIKNSWPIAFSAMLGVFMINTDMLMLGWWENIQEIGYYSAGQRIIQVLYIIPALFASAAFPILSRLITQQDKNQNRQKEQMLNERLITIVYAIAFPLCIGGIIVAPEFITLIFGTEYTPATLPFQILLVTLLIFFPGITLSNLAIAHNKQRATLPFVAIGALSNIVLNIVLIKYWGITGSAIATLLALLLCYGLIWRYLKTITRLYTLKHLRNIFIATAVMGAITYVAHTANLHVLLSITLAVSVYTAVVYALKDPILNIRVLRAPR